MHEGASNAWETAFNALDSDLKARLDTVVKECETDVLTLVLNEAEEKRKICLQKRWKVRLGSEQLILRDLFDKIIAWVNEFKAVGDVAVQYNPTPAAIPWAGVRFLLQVAVKHNQYHEATVQGLEKTARLITRYAAFEALYVESGRTLSDQVHSELVKLYTQMLVFLANGVKYFSQPSAVRAAKTLFQSTEYTELRNITTLDDELQKLAAVVDAQAQHQLQSDVSSLRVLVEALSLETLPRGRSIDTSAIYPTTLDTETFHSFLKWLSPVPYTQHHSRRSEKRLPNSAQWLLQHPQYLSWHAESFSSIILIHGIQGCGKSTMFSAVVDSMLELSQKNTSIASPLVYFYCGDSKLGKSKADAAEVMRSLTRQLSILDASKFQAHEQVMQAYQRRAAEANIDGFEVPRFEIADCIIMILQILGSNPATIMVDGLDEVEEQQRPDLLDAFVRIRDESASIAKIFLTSRDNTSTFLGLERAMFLRVEAADTRKDMESFVDFSIAQSIKKRRLLNGNVPNSLQSNLKRFLLQQAGEMFLWVNLQMERICQLKSTKSVQEALKPHSTVTTRNVSELYFEILQGIAQADETSYAIVTTAFSWLMCMNEPISSNAFVNAISRCALDEEKFDLTAQELEAVCSSLLVLDTQLDVFRFSHSTLREFLEQKYDFSAPHINQVAAIACLRTCTEHPVDDTLRELQPQRSLDHYAALYWPRHCMEALNGIPQSVALRNQLIEFVFYEGEELNPAFLSWMEAIVRITSLLSKVHPLKKELDAVISSASSPFFTACIYGLDCIHEAMCRQPGFDINMRNNIGHTGLYLASLFGHERLVQVMLQKGAETCISCGRHGSALQAAAFGGYTSIVDVLIQQEISNNKSIQDNLDSALTASFLSGYEDVAILLLNNKEYMSGQAEYDKIMEEASQVGFSRAVETLAQRFPPYSRSSGDMPSRALHLAISKGQVAFVKKYMAQDLLPSNSIATAALFGQLQVASLCLDHGMDIENSGVLGTPLRVASLVGNEAMVRLLIERGADVNAVSSMGDALQSAAMNGHHSITNLLLQNNAQLSNYCGYYGNPLQAAVLRGHVKVVELLLGFGASVNTSGRYPNAIQAAIEGDQEEMVDLLLAKGDPVLNWPDNIRRAMHSCVPSSPFKNLLQAEGYTSLAENESRRYEPTPEGKLSDRIPIAGRVEVYSFARDLLLSEDRSSQTFTSTSLGKHVDRRSRFLQSAVRTGNVALVKKLLQYKGKLHIDEYDLGQSLYSASALGFAGVVRYVISEKDFHQDYLIGSIERAAWYGWGNILDILLLHLSNLKTNLLTPTCGSQQENSFPRATRHFAPFEYQHNILAMYNTDQVNELLMTASDLPRTYLILSACRANQVALIQRELPRISQKDREGLQQVAVIEAAKYNSVDSIKFFLAHAKVSRTLQTSDLSEGILIAAESGSKSALELLMQVQLPLICSSDMHQLLLDQVLVVACVARQKSIVDFAISNGANVDCIVTLKLDEPLRSCSVQRAIVDHRRYYVGQAWPCTVLQLCLRKDVHEMDATQESIIALLIRNGANVDLVDEDGCQDFPICSAALNCSQAIMEAMIAVGANVNRNSPLAQASRREINSMPILQTLHTAGAHNLSQAVPHALSYFGRERHLERRSATATDSEHGLFIDSQSRKQVLTTGPGAVLKYILQNLPELSTDDPRYGLLLQFSAAEGHLDLVEMIICRGRDINEVSYFYGTALQAAARFGQTDCVKALIEKGADVNIVGGECWTALQAAAMGGHLQVVQVLVHCGAKYFVKEPTTKLNILYMLLERNKYLPAIHLALEKKHIDVARFLLQDRVDISLNAPALRPFVEMKDISPLKQLIGAGIDPTAEFPGFPPLLITAVKHGDFDMVKLLIARGADVNAARVVCDSYNQLPGNSCGATALHQASARGDVKIVSLLLKNGAEVNKIVADSTTAIAVATWAEQEAVKDLLLSYGASEDGT